MRLLDLALHVLEGDRIKLVDQQASTLPDCPALLTSLLGFDSPASWVDSLLRRMQQESGGNPESVGDGGGGLIGWTPLPGGYVTVASSRRSTR